MVKKLFSILGVVLLAFVVSSCTARAYVQEKSRVDQEIKGNAGCFQGTCPEEDRSGIRKTRKTYVLEIAKKSKIVQAEDVVVEEADEYTMDDYSSSSGNKGMVIEQVIIHQEPQEDVVLVDYTILEGDTLQKISKKVYGTYKRWYDIYEINRDLLPNPDRIKPGKIIRIPQK